MPKIQSAKKALRQNVRRRKINLTRRAKTKTTIKEFQKLIVSGKKEEAKNYLPQVYKTLDKMAKINFIQKGKANRLKSKFAKKLKTVK